MRLALEYYKEWQSDTTSISSKVRRFQIEKMLKVLPAVPTPPTPEQIVDIIGRTYEELREMGTAMMAGDMPGFVDSVCDSIYTLLGALWLCGVDPDPILHEIHSANMDKQPATLGGFGRTTAEGKNTKQDWTPPRITELLEIQTLNGQNNGLCDL